MSDDSSVALAEARLLDRVAIEAVLSRYARAIDRIDVAAIKSTFWPGAIDQHGTFNGPAEEFADYLGSALHRFVTTVHAISNVHVEFHGDAAHVETYVRATHIQDLGSGPICFTLYARYLDKFEKRRGEWRIVHRLLVRDWLDVPKEAPEIRSFLEKIERTGKPAPDDCWYSELLGM